jgi:hypothetical protein
MGTAACGHNMLVMETKQDVRDVLIRVVRIENILDFQVGLLHTLQSSIAAMTLQIAGLQPLPVQTLAPAYPLFSAPHCAAQSQLPAASGFQPLPVQPPAQVFPLYAAPQQPAVTGLQPLPVQPPAQVYPLFVAPHFAAQPPMPAAAGLQPLPVLPPAQMFPLHLAPKPSTAALDSAQPDISSSCENQAACTFAGCNLKIKDCSAAKSLRHMQTCAHCPAEGSRYLHIAQHMTNFERHPRGVVDLDVCCWCSDKFPINLLPDARSRHKSACLQKAIITLQVGGFFVPAVVLFMNACCNNL